MILHFVDLLVPLFAPFSLSALLVLWSVVTPSLYTASATFMNMHVIHTGYLPLLFRSIQAFYILSIFRAFGEVELQNFNNLLVELRTLVANNRCVLFYNSSINLHIRFWGIQTLYRDMLTHWTTALTSLVLWRRRWHPSTGKLWTDQGGDLFRWKQKDGWNNDLSCFLDLNPFSSNHNVIT